MVLFHERSNQQRSFEKQRVSIPTSQKVYRIKNGTNEMRNELLQGSSADRCCEMNDLLIVRGLKQKLGKEDFCFRALSSSGLSMYTR